MSELKVLSVASEIFPLVKTGGLADVTGALPGALAREGVEMRTLVPAYPAVKGKLLDAAAARDYDNLFGGPARVLAGKAAGLDVFAVDAPHLFARPGNPYLGADGLDWPDNARRFAALARVGADIGLGAIGRFLSPIFISRTDLVRARRSPSTTSPSRAIFPFRSSANWACLRARCRSTGSSISAASAI